MHYYQHNIPDFNNATRHLTRLERSIYRDLIELYYDTEAPLCDAVAQIARRVLVTGDEEMAALELVLDEFFTLEDDGYHHDRCDRELAKVYEKSVKARVSAEQRWKKKGRKKGEKRSDSERNANAMRTQCERNATQDLLPNNPRPNNTLPNKPLVPVESADRVIDRLNTQAEKNYRFTDNNRKPILARMAEGFSEQDCIRVVDGRCMRWKGTEQAQYLRPSTLFQPSKFESYLNDAGEVGNGQNDPVYNPRETDKLLREMFPDDDQEPTAEPPKALPGGTGWNH